MDAHIVNVLAFNLSYTLMQANSSGLAIVVETFSPTFSSHMLFTLATFFFCICFYLVFESMVLKTF